MVITGGPQKGYNSEGCAIKGQCNYWLPVGVRYEDYKMGREGSSVNLSQQVRIHASTKEKWKGQV